jgi:aspartate racemase
MNAFTPPCIGIIGGAGPMAGALMFQKIIQICQEKYGCKQDADFPAIMLYSYPFADMLSQPWLNQEVVANQLRECILKLKQNGATVIAIACNTLHTFLDLNEIDSLSFVHMIQATGDWIKQKQVKKTFVLCTKTSAEAQLHQRYFNCSYPNELFQLNVDRLIQTIMAGKQSQEDAKTLSQQINQYVALEENSIGLVLGCTEFSTFNDQFALERHGLSKRFSVFDPNQIVAEKICQIAFNA